MQSEWKLSFDYIENNWTDEQFLTMANRLVERLKEQKRRHETALQKSKGGARRSRAM